MQVVCSNKHILCLLSCLLIILLSLSCGVSFFCVWGVLPVTPEAPLLSLASAADVLLTEMAS
jgi:hypothetical protein